MGMRQRIRTGLGQGVITCVLRTQFSSYMYFDTFVDSNITFNPEFCLFVY